MLRRVEYQWRRRTALDRNIRFIRRFDRQALAGLRVLVVDDMALMHTLVRGILQAAGAKEVIPALSGPAALKALRRRRYDLIILDRNMPGMNGVELVRHLREAGVTVPVLMVTAERDEDMLREALDAGVTDFLSKPISAHILLDRIRKVLPAA